MYSVFLDRKLQENQMCPGFQRTRINVCFDISSHFNTGMSIWHMIWNSFKK